MLRYVLLALMADGKPTHGYALMKAYEERSGIRLSIGNVYRELQWLVGEGLIATAINPPGADPRRAPYAITAGGRQALGAWLATPAYALMRVAPDAICHRLALAADMDQSLLGSFLDDLHGELWSQSKVVERERAIVDQRARHGDRAVPTRAILLERRARHLAADIEMVDQMRSLLGSARRRRSASSLHTSAVAEAPPGRVAKQRSRAGEGTDG